MKNLSELTDEGALRRLLATHEEYVFRGAGRPEERADKVAEFKAARKEVLKRLKSPRFKESRYTTPNTMD